VLPLYEKHAVITRSAEEKIMRRRIDRSRHSRRDVIRMGAAAGVAAGAGPAFAAHSAWASQEASAEGPLVIGGWGGRFTESTRTFFAEPFTAETGIEVQIVDAPGEQMARIMAQRDAGKMEWDLADALSAADSYIAFNQGLAAKLPTELKTELEGMVTVVNDWGFAFSSLAHVIACNMDEADACPTTPEEFWDVESFPGPRVLSSFNTIEVLTLALQGAGVPDDELFPMDLDLAFSKLEELRPNVPVWYTSGDQSEQVLRDGEVVMGQVWSGRAFNVADQGVNLEVVWDRAIYEPGFWFVWEGAPHQEAAFQFLRWMASNAEAQAKWATEMRYGPANPEAFEFMEEDVAKRMAEYPENFEKLVVPDWQWFAENSEEILTRWNEFLAG
jgi:putative spermidine/putrescine transport system substrate-binding protein